MILNLLLSAIISYLIGSISPSFIIGKILKGIDIREYGDGNAGTINIGSVVGIWAALLTAFFDTSKGIISILISFYLFSLPEFLVYIPVFFTIIGHIFPFYLNFKGGQGAATASGVLLFYLIKIVSDGQLSYLSLLPILIVMLLSIIATGNGETIGLITTSFMGYVFIASTGFNFETIPTLLLSLSIFLFLLVLRNSVIKKLFVIKKRLDTRIWKIILRSFAFIFIPIDFYYGKKVLLIILVILVFIFLFIDTIRIFSKISLYNFFKKREFKRFSSITGFLISLFFIFLLFPQEISFFTLGFLIAGSLYNKFIEIKFGKRKIFKNKTIEGSIGFLTGSFIAGYTIYSIFKFNIIFLITGSIVAAVVELLSINIDDNFSVGILTSSFLYAIKYFFL